MSRLLHTLQSPKTTVQQPAAKGAANPLQARCKALHGVLHQVLHAALPLKGEECLCPFSIAGSRDNLEKRVKKSPCKCLFSLSDFRRPLPL